MCSETQISAQTQPGEKMLLVSADTARQQVNLITRKLEEKPSVPEGEMSYQEMRRLAYPSIGDQLDAIWKGGAAANEMRARIQFVKEKIPKD